MSPFTNYKDGGNNFFFNITESGTNSGNSSIFFKSDMLRSLVIFFFFLIKIIRTFKNNLTKINIVLVLITGTDVYYLNNGNF